MNDMPGAYQNRIVTEPQREVVPKWLRELLLGTVNKTKKSVSLPKDSGTD
jgi:hypothetical protein